MIESPLLRTLGGYINGTWHGADSPSRTNVINPATGETIATVPRMGAAETHQAIDAASRALAHPSSMQQRQKWLGQLAELVSEQRTELGRIITHEHGKPWNEAQGEAEYAASFFRYYARCVDHLQPKQLSERPRDHSWTVHYRPAGVAALVTPWNFPLAMLAKKFSAMLAADCTCVVKPSSKTPLSVIALFSLLEQLELPPGKANLVLGPAGEISDVLCQHPAVRVISFTGSTEVGKKLLAATAPHIKRLALELGGNAPFIVFDDADLDRAVEQFVGNKFRGAGQTCVCANRVYVQRGVADTFAEKLAARVQQMKVGNGMEDGVDVGPLIDQNAYDKVQRHVDDALQHGAQRVAEQRAVFQYCRLFLSPHGAPRRHGPDGLCSRRDVWTAGADHRIWGRGRGHRSGQPDGIWTGRICVYRGRPAGRTGHRPVELWPRRVQHGNRAYGGSPVWRHETFRLWPRRRAGRLARLYRTANRASALRSCASDFRGIR